MQRTVLHIVSLTALLLGAAVAILFGALSRSTASESSPQLPESHQSSPTQTTGLVVTFEVPEDAADVLPGERVKFRVSVENSTDYPHENLYVGVFVSHNPKALKYVDGSIFISYGDRARIQGTTLDGTFDPGESAEVEWEMAVSECAVRDRWVQVVFLARTDGHDLSHTFKNVYLYPHTSIPTHHFTPSYHVDPQTPAPGDAVRHTVRVVNDGYMRLDNVVVHVNGHKTIDRYLPTIAANSVYHLVSRGDESTSSGSIGSGWSGSDTGFNLNYLNPGQTLVLSWVDYVAPDAPVGTVVRPQVDIRPVQANKWTPVAGRLTISPPANDLSMSVRSIDPEYLTPSYLPGDRVTIRVIVANHTATARDDLRVDLDLPFALSYVPGSTYLCTGQGDGDDGCGAIYTVPPYQDGNARRVPDNWLDTSAPLPILRPGETAAITFRATILENALPQQNITLHAALRSASRGDEHRATTHLDIVRKAEIDVTVDGPTTAESDDEISYEVSITNTGQSDLANVTFGIEETCGITYVPGTLEITLPSGETTQDDSFLIDQRRDLDDTTYLIGDLPAWTPNGPNNEAKVRLTMQIADDVDPGNIAGPRFVVNAESNAPAVAGTKNVRLQGIREGTEIEVVEPLVTAAEFEARVEELLGEIEEGATKTAENTDRILALAETAREINEEIKDITTATGATATELGETSSAIRANTDAIGKATTAVGATAKQVRDKLFDEDPWGQSTQWILRVGGFAALASLIAGLVLPFSLWRGLVWVRRHRHGWRRPILWATDLCRAGATLLATARRRVRDWIDGLWRR